MPVVKTTSPTACPSAPQASPSKRSPSSSSTYAVGSEKEVISGSSPGSPRWTASPGGRQARTQGGSNGSAIAPTEDAAWRSSGAAVRRGIPVEGPLHHQLLDRLELVAAGGAEQLEQRRLD